MTSTDETVQLVSYHDPISDQTTLVASKVDQISFCSRHALIPMYFHWLLLRDDKWSKTG